MLAAKIKLCGALIVFIILSTPTTEVQRVDTGTATLLTAGSLSTLKNQR